MIPNLRWEWGRGRFKLAYSLVGTKGKPTPLWMSHRQPGDLSNMMWTAAQPLTTWW